MKEIKIKKVTFRDPNKDQSNLITKIATVELECGITLDHIAIVQVGLYNHEIVLPVAYLGKDIFDGAYRFTEDIAKEVRNRIFHEYLKRLEKDEFFLEEEELPEYKEGDLVVIKPIIFKFHKQINENQFDAEQYDDEGNLIDTWTLNYRDTEPYKELKDEEGVSRYEYRD